MSVLHLCGSHVNGGASRAAYRIHRCLVDADYRSLMRVLDYESQDPTVLCGFIEGSESLPRLVKRRLLLKALAWRGRHFHSSYPSYLSTAWPDTGILREPALAASQLIHLHWIGKHLISIEEIGRIKQPLVWTLHDQWPFSGAEHYASPQDNRFVLGYPANHRPDNETGPDINRSTFLRKLRHWKQPIQIVVTTQWMARCVQSSFLMRDWPLHVIPYPLDLDQWSPLSCQEARSVLGLPLDCQVILFSASDPFINPIKGGDLLLAALEHLDPHRPVLLLVAGQASSPVASSSPVPIRFLGALNDTISLRLAYGASDVVVVPSRRESFCQVASEAHACGRPVVAFAEGGLTDVVDDRKTGALAAPSDPLSLAAMLNWTLSDPDRWCELSHQARLRAEALWSPAKIAQDYQRVYESALLPA
jgi:glycosyltransferase involved in cell wall biosynthesis